MLKWFGVFLAGLLLLSCSVEEEDQNSEIKGEGLEAFSKSERQEANTARNEAYLSTVEKEVFFYLNLARRHPAKFVKVFLEKYEHAPGYNKGYAFDERKASLIQQLNRQEPLALVNPSRELFSLAECFAVAQGKAGYTGHGRGGTGCEDGYHAECCDYGDYASGLYIILELLIDSGRGNEALGHRKILLSDYRCMGVAQRAHTRYGKCAVLDFWTREGGAWQ